LDIVSATLQQRINARFVATMKSRGRKKAYTQWRDDLMENAHILTSAGVFTYDKLIEKVAQIEGLIGDDSGDPGNLDPIEKMRNWLNSQETGSRLEQ
jgi:hypothetical protein